MSRLIDADTLIERIKEEKEDNDAHCIRCMDSIINIIDAQLTVDAVVHGEWIRQNKEKIWGKSTEIVCSICGKKSWLEFDFCPNCGADMRKVK